MCSCEKKNKKKKDYFNAKQKKMQFKQNKNMKMNFQDGSCTVHTIQHLIQCEQSNCNNKKTK